MRHNTLDLTPGTLENVLGVSPSLNFGEYCICWLSAQVDRTDQS